MQVHQILRSKPKASVITVAPGATVAEAAPEVLDRALWVASRPAGAGAVRQFAEFLLRSQGKFEALLAPYLSGVP